MTYRGIFEYEYPTEHKPPVSIDVNLHGDCVRGKIIEWEYRPQEQESKPMVEIDLYSVIKQKYIEREVLDKIRAELIQSIQNGVLKIESGNEALFNILDKYMAESEVEDGNER